MSATLTPVAREDRGEETRPYLSAFDDASRESSGGECSWLKDLRDAGISHFAGNGFPTLKQEDWRFTNVAPIRRLPFKPVRDSAGAVTREQLERLAWPGVSEQRLVFVDGFFAPDLSAAPRIKGVQIGSLREMIARDAGAIERHLGQHVRPTESGFTALNAAFFQDGTFLSVPAGTVIETPITLLFVSTAREPGAAMHVRNLICLGAQARATVIEQYVSLATAPYLTNAATEIILGANAEAGHYKIQNEDAQHGHHVATLQACQARDSRLTTHSISIGARFARNDIRTRFDDQGGQCVLNGLYLGKDNQFVDHHTTVDHAQPHCESHEFYHGILDGASQGVFNGKIFVRAGAQKTNAKQNNRNLLLSEDATINTKPQLEIFADDVKCTHGATVGQLDEDAMFYLRARGLPHEAARLMLIYAFASDVVQRIDIEPLRAALDRILMERLGGEGRV